MSTLGQHISSLSLEQRAVLELRLKKKRESSGRAPLIRRRSDGADAPLSFAQQRLWFLDQLEPGSAFYNGAAAVRLKGKLNVAALEQALSAIVRRHEILRTTFPALAARPVQIVAAPQSLALSLRDLSGLSAIDKEKEATRLADEEVARPFDLARGPLLRCELLRLASHEHVLLLGLHHIIGDGWSIAVFIRELATLYHVFSRGEVSPLPELPIQYADYAYWQREWLQGETLQQQSSYWKQKLSPLPEPLELPSDRPRPVVQTFRGAKEYFTLSPELSESLRTLSRREGCTPFMTLLAAFQALLFRYTGSADITVGSPVAGRGRSETEDLIGFFVNMLVMRTSLAGNPTFRELLSRVREVALAAFSHQDFPFEKLVEEVQPQRDLSRNPLFQVMFALHNLPQVNLELPGLQVEVKQIESGAAKFDLYLSMNDAGTLNGAFEYNTDLFDSTTITRLIGHWSNLLTQLVGNVDQKVARVPLLSSSEEEQLVTQWNKTKSPYEREWCVHRLFELQAAWRPEAIAVKFAGEAISYGELNARANRLAHYLRSLGVVPETLVGVFVQRSSLMIVSLLAVLKTGGAYVPLDPDFPEERLAGMIEDAGIGFLLTQQSLIETLPRHSARVVCVDGKEAADPDHSWTNPPRLACAENLAYVIYTSGSTGAPKGVQVTHRSVNNFLTAMARRPGLASGDVLPAVTTLSFDIAGLEILLPLTVGACVVLASREVASDGALLAQLISECGATVMQATPATWRMLLQAGWSGSKTLKVLCGGEALNRDLAGELRRITASLWNLYGPTETTIWSAAYSVEIEPHDTVPIGGPIANTQIYLLDEELQAVPIGVAARLFIGGDGLARGYLKRPAQTAERFLPNPWSGEPGARLYDTGDLARYLVDGTIEYLGRVDQQVKVRGYRIELGEIETVLSEHAAVSEAVVVVQEEERAAGRTEKRLVGYLVLSGGASEPSVAELRAHLSEQLPGYMIPGAFVVRSELPLTPNGKVDRRALAALAVKSAEAGTEYLAPRNAVEEVVSEIWAGVLGRERVGVRENFFELGGHSLLATQVVSRVREAFGVELPLRRLFEQPTVEGLAQGIEAQMTVEPRIPLTPLQHLTGQSEFPLSYAQRRLWFLDQLEPENPFYNMATAVRLSGPLDIAILGRALDEIVSRHDVLRSVFSARDGKPVQVMLPALKLTIPVTDLSSLSRDLQEAQVLQLACEEMKRPFNLESGPLLRTSLLRLDEHEHVALLTIHHIVSDGWSLKVFLSELNALYESFSADRSSPLPDLTIQYGDFAFWQCQWLAGEALKEQLNYWVEALRGAPGLLGLPTDRPRPAIQSFRGQRQTLSLPKDLHASLKAACRQRGVTPFMFLLAAFNVLLWRYSRQPDIVVGTPIAGRTRLETEGLMGFFANTLALRADLSGNPTVNQLLARTREMCLGAYANQDLPFEKLVEALQPERSLSHHPLFQVMFALQNAQLPELLSSGLRLTPLEIDSGVARFDLLLNVLETEQGLTGVCEYNCDLFDSTSIVRLLSHWRNLLSHFVRDGEQVISRLPLLLADERQQIVVDWNSTESTYEKDLCVHELFERQAARRAEAVAVVFESEQLSYGELNTRSNRLAHYLRSRGIGPDSLVGLCTKRSLEMIVGVLAILKAGAAYVPLDPEYPQARLQAMIDDAGVTVLLTQDQLLPLLPEHQVETVCLDRWWNAEANPEELENLASGVKAENLAYVIYTSGSTGKPKGVALPHRALTNLIEWHARTMLPGARTLQFASIGFDASFHELFAAWHTGGTVFVINEELRRDVHALARYLVDQHVEKVILPVVVLQQLAEEFLRTPETGLQLQEITTTGEQLQITTPVIEFFSTFPEIAFHNHYGPSETHVVTAYRMPDDITTWNRYPPIGGPIANTQIYLLDEELEAVPIGVAARLFIGGDGLARGYLKRPAQTAERFLPNPWSGEPGARLYDTGDLARYLVDGTIEYLGRVDQQVKVRGYRIELGEIETVLSEHAAVSEAVVVVQEEERLAGRTEKRLVGYLVLSGGASEPSVAELRAHLSEQLPGYMIPAAFVVRSELPLTPNGKVDRRALAALAVTSAEAGAEYQAPRNAVEEVVSEIWAGVLGRERVGVRENFFELGGHSLLATQVVSRVREAFGVELPLRRLFEQPTVEGLAGAVAQVSGDREKVEVIARTVRYVAQLSAEEVRAALANSQ